MRGYSKITVFDIIPPGSHNPGIRNSPIPNPGIEKTGPGLESLVAQLKLKHVIKTRVQLEKASGIQR